MADKEKSTTDAVLGLRQQLKNMSHNIRLFSFSIRSLYQQNAAVGEKAEASENFRKLRDDTRNDAMVYLKGILPLSTTFASSIRKYFDYYETLDFKEWCEKISCILDETVSYKQICETFLKMHEDILVPLKKRQHQAEVVVAQCKDLQQIFEKRMNTYEERGQNKRVLAYGLFFVPGLGHALKESAEADLAEADAHGTKAEVQEAAAIAIKDILIPSLERFIDGITEAAGFFSVMEHEIRKFEGKAEKGKESAKRLHYEVMKREAKDMKVTCQTFSEALPNVKSDFEAIPSEGTDRNYVDRCLREHRRTIQGTCTLPNLVNGLLAATVGNPVGDLVAAATESSVSGLLAAATGNPVGGLLAAATESSVNGLLAAATENPVSGLLAAAMESPSALGRVFNPGEINELVRPDQPLQTHLTRALTKWFL